MPFHIIYYLQHITAPGLCPESIVFRLIQLGDKGLKSMKEEVQFPGVHYLLARSVQCDPSDGIRVNSKDWPDLPGRVRPPPWRRL